MHQHMFYGTPVACFVWTNLASSTRIILCNCNRSISSCKSRLTSFFVIQILCCSCLNPQSLIKRLNISLVAFLSRGMSKITAQIQSASQVLFVNQILSFNACISPSFVSLYAICPSCSYFFSKPAFTSASSFLSARNREFFFARNSASLAAPLTPVPETMTTGPTHRSVR